MPKTIRSLTQIAIPLPCNADWETMIGNDQVRFCEHCSLHVTNLSTMTRQEAIRFVAQSRGRICVRYLERPGGGVLTQKMPEKLYHIGRKVSRVAAGAFTATLGLSNAAAQTQSIPNQRHETVELIQTSENRRSELDEFSGIISGSIKTTEGELITNATVVLVDRESGEERYTISNSGEYSFQLLAEGDYLLWVRKSGFRTAREVLKLAANAHIRQDLEMEPRMRFVMGGAMAATLVTEEPLLKAINAGDLETVRTLVSAPQKLARATRATAYLSEAVRVGNLQIVEVLLDAGGDPNSRITGKDPALLSLSEKATPELVHDLVVAGAKLNARDDYGFNGLMTAAASSSAAVIKELIEAGSPVNATNSAGETALFVAARSSSLEALVLLLESGTNINTRNEDGDTALMVAAFEGTFAKFKAMLDRGADATLINDDGKSLLLLAAENEDYQIAKLVVEMGGNVDAQDLSGETALMIAASMDREPIVTLLASSGADPNLRDSNGQTALIRAAIRGSVECARILIARGADATIGDNEGKTALDHARESNEDEIVALLTSRGALQ